MLLAIRATDPEQPWRTPRKKSLRTLFTMNWPGKGTRKPIQRPEALEFHRSWHLYLSIHARLNHHQRCGRLPHRYSTWNIDDICSREWEVLNRFDRDASRYPTPSHRSFADFGLPGKWSRNCDDCEFLSPIWVVPSKHGSALSRQTSIVKLTSGMYETLEVRVRKPSCDQFCVQLTVWVETLTSI